MPDKVALLRALQTEIQRHDFSTFVNEPPTTAQGGIHVAYTTSMQILLSKTKLHVPIDLHANVMSTNRHLAFGPSRDSRFWPRELRHGFDNVIVKTDETYA